MPTPVAPLAAPTISVQFADFLFLQPSVLCWPKSFSKSLQYFQPEYYVAVVETVVVGYFPKDTFTDSATLIVTITIIQLLCIANKVDEFRICTT